MDCADDHRSWSPAFHNFGPALWTVARRVSHTEESQPLPRSGAHVAPSRYIMPTLSYSELYLTPLEKRASQVQQLCGF